MKTWMPGLFLAVLMATAGNAADLLLSFNGGIAVDPVSGIAAGAPVLNVVRGISPGGVPWHIDRLTANVDADGRIKVQGRGLLLAGGNGIGTNGGQSVHAVLFCGPAATATAHSTDPAGVPLAANGDFRIDGTLTPAPPADCATPVLLVVSAANRWFAAGILANDGED